jgi:flagellar biogenesis protein FliO
VALLAAVAFALRRRRAVATARPARLAIEERLPLGRETGLALVTAHGRRLLVGHGPAGVSLLAELAADGEPPR